MISTRVELLAHQRMLTAIASGLVGPADADDVVQETFLRALARPPADTDAPIAPWLVTVAKNLAMDVLRQRGRFVELSEEEHGEASASLPARPSPPSLLAGLGQLTEGEVAVLLLRDWMDLDVDEVSHALETSPGSVRVLHHRARRKAATPAPLEQALSAVDRFLTWILGRAIAGLPLVGTGSTDAGLSQGVLVAYLGLLDAMVALARSRGEHAVEGRAVFSRGTARKVLGSPDAIADFERAIELGTNRTMAEVRLAPLLYTRGDTDRALAVALSALARGDVPPLHGVLHRVAARVYMARGDAEAAAPHHAALKALSEGDAQDAFAAFTRGASAIDEERFSDARADLIVALARNRAAAGHSRNEAIILNNLCFAALNLGELDEASDWGAEGLTVARNIGDRRGEGYLLGNVASIAQLRGHYDEAAAGFERAVARCIENEQDLIAEHYRAYAAVVLHQMGRVEEAVALLDVVVGRLANVPGMSLRPRIHRLGALAELGRTDDAAFDALAAEASPHPSLVGALALYRLLVRGDVDALARALTEPSGTALTERLARSILERAVRRTLDSR